MTELTINNPAVNEPEKAETPGIGERKNRSIILAIIFGLISSPAGYLYVGKGKRALLSGFVQIIITVLSVIFFQVFFSISALILVIIPPFLVHFIFLLNIIVVAVHEGKEYHLKHFNRWYFYVLIIIMFNIPTQLIGRIQEIHLVGSHTISSDSMEYTIYADEDVMINKMAYGIRSATGDGYHFFFHPPERGEIVSYKGYIRNSGMIEEKEFISRCAGIAGDKIIISEFILYVNDQIEDLSGEYHEPEYELEEGKHEQGIFPENSGWNRSYYGPLVVPAKGNRIVVTKETINSWAIFILIDNDIDPTEGFSKEKVFEEYVDNLYYIVKKDYIFLVDDNRGSSSDSRTMGFVPYDNITGRAEFIMSPHEDEGIKRLGKKLK